MSNPGVRRKSGAGESCFNLGARRESRSVSANEFIRSYRLSEIDDFLLEQDRASGRASCSGSAASSTGEDRNCYQSIVRSTSTPSWAACEEAGDSSVSAVCDDSFKSSQLQILEEIQRENRNKKKESTSGTSEEAKASGIDPTTLSNSHQRNSQRLHSKGCLSFCKKSGDGAADNWEDDQVLVFPNGRIIRLKGTQHTHEAIERGNATLVHCFNCRSSMQVSSRAKAVYCPVCHEATPIDLARVCSPFADPRSATSRSAALYDRKIARSIQHDEIDVAVARKVAKNAPRR